MTANAVAGVALVLLMLGCVVVLAVCVVLAPRVARDRERAEVDGRIREMEDRWNDP